MAERTFRVLKPGFLGGPYGVGDTFAVRTEETWQGALELVDHPGSWANVDTLVKYGDIEEVTAGG